MPTTLPRGRLGTVCARKSISERAGLDTGWWLTTFASKQGNDFVYAIATYPVPNRARPSVLPLNNAISGTAMKACVRPMIFDLWL